MDRASVFADDEVIDLLRTRIVPVAVDEWYHVRRKDPEGEYYRSVVYQREGLDPKEDRTTQGFYLFTPGGKLLRGWNNRDTDKAKRFLRSVLDGYRPPETAEIPEAEDPRFARSPGEGGVIADVFTRVLEADWPPPRDEWQSVLRSATGRDHLWIRKGEAEALAAGKLPASVTKRIALFHLVDNTRGEPPMWRESEVRKAEWKLIPGGKEGTYRIEGDIRLSTEKGDRGYEAALLGRIESKDGKLVRFDVVARGEFWGEGRYTRGAPPGRFTLGIAFRLAERGEAAKVPPQGARDFAGYYGSGP
jgi:hypothetical protein